MLKIDQLQGCGSQTMLKFRTLSSMFSQKVPNVLLRERDSEQWCQRAFGVLRLQETDTCEFESTRMADMRRGEKNCHRQSHTKPWLS